MYIEICLLAFILAGVTYGTLVQLQQRDRLNAILDALKKKDEAAPKS